ncbi:MAG: hypothetical protein ABF904_04875 [Ethanoligenens sp.]
MKDAVKKWFVNNEKRNVVLVALSAVALILSLSGLLGRALPFDIAWVAILLSNLPQPPYQVVFICPRPHYSHFFKIASKCLTAQKNVLY